MGAGERLEISVRDPDLVRNAMKFSGRTCRKLGQGGVFVAQALPRVSQSRDH
jgi:hypothetical protein